MFKALFAYVHLVVLTSTGWPASTDGLDGDLARLQQRPRRKNDPVAHARRVAALSRCGELPGVRASAAAAVRCRGKASGRRVVRRVPPRARGAALPRQFSAGTRARLRAARRAAR
jgi:hypothetical protein